MNGGAIPKLVQLLQHDTEELADQAAWALGNIAGDCAQNRDRVLAAGAMPTLLKLLDLSVPPVVGQGTLRNSMWFLSNL